MWTGNSVRFSPQTLVDLRSAGKYHSRKRLRTVSSGCSSQSAMWEATLSKEQQRARIMPKDHSASPLSCGLLKSGKVFVRSFVQTYNGSWPDMVHLPSIPKVVHRQNGETALSCQVLSPQVLTIILEKNPIPERPRLLA